jgi:exopolyphosphatase/pppGpp-phosphohydrolase
VVDEPQVELVVDELRRIVERQNGQQDAEYRNLQLAAIVHERYVRIAEQHAANKRARTIRNATLQQIDVRWPTRVKIGQPKRNQHKKKKKKKEREFNDVTLTLNRTNNAHKIFGTESHGKPGTL